MQQPPAFSLQPSLPDVFSKLEHKFHKLENGITCLLISMPQHKPLASLLLFDDGANQSVQSSEPPNPEPPLASSELELPRIRPRSSLRSHLNRSTRTSIHSGSVRSASSSLVHNPRADRRASIQAYGYSLMEQSKRAEAQRKRLNAARAAGCALCVNVGSLSDPPHAQGLAHLVEHSIFMGSDLFPVETDWDRFLSVIGGESNAVTEAERTTFHFTAPQDYFEDTLERFARFFVKPLLRQSSLERELRAIDSEFNDAAGDVGFRSMQVHSCTARSSTPYSQFSCGNSITLGDVPDLQDFVSSFFLSHYLADSMVAVLYSCESLDSLTRLAVLRLGEIPAVRINPHLGKVPPRFAASSFLAPFCPYSPQSPSTIGQDGAVLGCVLVTDPGFGYPSSLVLTWLLPSQRPHYLTKPLWYLINLFEHETAGSIIHRARALGLATELSCADPVFSSSQFASNEGFSLLEITIVLTELGLLQWRQVASLVFEYIGMLKTSGMPRYVFDELQQCSLARFLFDTNLDLSEMLESLAQRLCPNSGVPPAAIFDGDALLYEFDSQLISLLVAQLLPQSARIELRTNASGLRFNVPPHRNLRSKVFNALRGTRRVEPHYGTPFEICPTPADCETLWSKALDEGAQARSNFAALPQRNEYVPVDFAVLPIPKPLEVGLSECDIDLHGERLVLAVCIEDYALVISLPTNERRWMRLGPGQILGGKSFKIVAPQSKQVRHAEFSPTFAPALISNDPGLAFWHLQAGQFSPVKIEFCLVIKFPMVLLKKPLNATLADLLLHVYAQTINAEMFPALLAGTALKMCLVGNEYRLTYSGFAEKVALLVDRTLPLFIGMAIHGTSQLSSPQTIGTHVESLRTSYANHDQIFSKTLEDILCLDEHDVAVKIKALGSVGSRNLSAFAIKALSKASITALLYGNVNLMGARKLDAKIRSMVRANKLGSGGAPGKRRIMLVHSVKTPTPPKISGPCAAFLGNGPSSSVLVYLQVSNVALASLKVELAAQVLSNPLFFRFREELAVAYHVSTWATDVDGVRGLTIEVSSHHVHCLDLLQNIDEFLLVFCERLRNMSEQEWRQHVNTLCAQKLQRDVSAADEAQRHLGTILRFDTESAYRWNRDALEAEQLFQGNLLDRQGFIEFFETHLSPLPSSARRKLNLLVLGEVEVRHGALEAVKQSITEYGEGGQDPDFRLKFGDCMPWLGRGGGRGAKSGFFSSAILKRHSSEEATGE